MKRKTVYLYDPVSLRYVGAYEAQESPLEPGVFIKPIHSLEDPLPETKEGDIIYFDGVGGWLVRNTPTPTQEQKLDIEIERRFLAVRQHMTATAKASPERFNSIAEAKSYVGTKNPLSTVSEAFQVWAAEVHTAAIKILNDVIAGKRPLPEISALINELPKWVHP